MCICGGLGLLICKVNEETESKDRSTSICLFGSKGKVGTGWWWDKDNTCLSALYQLDRVVLVRLVYTV